MQLSAFAPADTYRYRVDPGTPGEAHRPEHLVQGAEA